MTRMIRQKRAFTLIEVVVVMLIIAITIGVVGISVKSLQARNDLQPFVDRLYQKLTTLGYEATLRQTEIGCSFYNNKIEILHYRLDDPNTVWRVKDKINVPSSIKLSLKITESNMFRKNLGQIDNHSGLDFYNNNNSPEIIFSSGGQLLPFRLIISHPDENINYIIKGEFSGELSMEVVDDSVEGQIL